MPKNIVTKLETEESRTVESMMKELKSKLKSDSIITLAEGIELHTKNYISEYKTVPVYERHKMNKVLRELKNVKTLPQRHDIIIQNNKEYRVLYRKWINGGAPRLVVEEIKDE